MPLVATVDPKAALEAAAAYSQTLTGWALLILGGSVLALLQRGYMRPSSKTVRYTYLLFGVGWISLACSIFFGSRVQQALLGYLFNPLPDFARARDTVNSDLVSQVRSLEGGLLVFGLWLGIYLVWWIWTKQDMNSKE